MWMNATCNQPPATAGKIAANGSISCQTEHHHTGEEMEPTSLHATPEKIGDQESEADDGRLQ